MATSDIQMYAESVLGQVDRIVDSLQGLSDDEISQPPPVPGANSLLVLAVHTMANVEENVFEVIGGQSVGRDRDSEFRVRGSTARQVQGDWETLRGRIHEYFQSMTPEMLDREYEHVRRGRMTGRGVLLLAATHAAEHAGHAELTRDWLVSER